MKLPESYIIVHQAIQMNEVSLGVGGIKLFSADEIEEGQVGYSVAPDGTSLCSNGEGSWQSSWIAIGYEMACGDPLFMDIADPALPVLTAHAWRRHMGADASSDFFQRLRTVV